MIVHPVMEESAMESVKFFQLASMEATTLMLIHQLLMFIMIVININIFTACIMMQKVIIQT